MSEYWHRVVRGAMALVMLAAPAWAQSSLSQIKAEYVEAGSQLKKHQVHDFWIDDAPESAELLAKQWLLAGNWVAAWLNAHPAPDRGGLIDEGLKDLGDKESQFWTKKPQYLALGNDAYLVIAPNSFGNVFIVAKEKGAYRLKWSTAQPQPATGRQASILAAWRPENARHGGRGPYLAAYGACGPVSPSLGTLPTDRDGHARFYIEGEYAQSAGGEVGAQISLWMWDGANAHLLIARDYVVSIDESVGTRLDGNLLKVQQKRAFRTFYSCAPCEERQTDWIVQINPDGIREIGEKSVVPELDAVDELFHRLIHGRPVAGLASVRAVKTARQIVQEARSGSGKDWKTYPTLGMMDSWRLDNDANGKSLCLCVDWADMLVRLQPRGKQFFIAAIEERQGSCRK